MTGKKRGKKMKAVTAWGGFSDDKLDRIRVDTGFGGWQTEGFAIVPAVFRSRKEARRQYQDVRRVLISEIPSGRGK